MQSNNHSKHWKKSKRNLKLKKTQKFSFLFFWIFFFINQIKWQLVDQKHQWSYQEGRLHYGFWIFDNSYRNHSKVKKNSVPFLLIWRNLITFFLHSFKDIQQTNGSLTTRHCANMLCHDRPKNSTKTMNKRWWTWRCFRKWSTRLK